MTPTLAPAKKRSESSLFAPIAGDIEEVERILEETLNNSRPGVDRLLAHLAHYKGKRLRPALLLLVARACGNVTSAHHILAAVLEMIHTATLVHDDVLDGASVRRHVQTVNSLWGNQASILLGDYLFTHAFHLASTVDVRACKIIGESTNRLCEGELHQVVRRGTLDLTEDEYFDIIDGKTAELTACACKLGALYAGTSDEVVERMTRFGRSIGMAFQIADDVLDLAGQETLAGKSLGTDLEQQKLTLPVIYLLQSDQSARARAILTAAENHKREALLPLLQACGALDYARHRAEEFATSAAGDLECLPPSMARMVLSAVTNRVVHRDS